MGDESFDALRLFASWTVLVGTCLASLLVGALIIYQLFKEKPAEGWFLKLVEKQFASIILVPVAAIGSICVILIFEVTAGSIVFEALGFKFAGASGPVVLWIFCFLAFLLGIKLLLKNDDKKTDLTYSDQKEIKR